MKRFPIWVYLVVTWIITNAVYLVATGKLSFVANLANRSPTAPLATTNSSVKIPDSPSDQRGFCIRTHIDALGQSSRYTVFIPYDYTPDKPIPAIVSLNGWGENGNDGILQVNFGLGLAVWEMKRSFPFLVIFPQCDSKGQWDADGPQTERAMRILEEVRSCYGVDRVFLTGVSAGGTGAWLVASKHADKFAGLVPLCGVPQAEAVIAPIVKSKLPIWNYYLDGDEPHLVDANRTAFELLIACGASPHTTEIHDVGHNCWDHAYRDVGLYAWMLSKDVGDRWDTSGFVPLPLSPWPSDQWQHSNGEPIETLPGDAVRLRGNDASSRSLVRSQPELYEAVHLCFRPQPTARWIEVAFASVDESPQQVIRIANPLLANSFIANGQQQLATASPSTWGSFRESQWNDLRIRRSEGEVNVSLNGWPLMTAKDPQSHPVQTRLELRLSSGEGAVDLQHLRVKFAEAPQ